MSRHRIVRTMDYKDECDGYDDIYGHSVDDDNSCISPTDAQQWLYDRSRGQQSMSSFLRDNKDIAEEDENASNANKLERRDSDNFQIPVLCNEIEKAKLNSCIDEVRNVVGDAISDRRIVDCSMRYGYDVPKVLDFILNGEDETMTNKEKPKNKVRSSSPLPPPPPPTPSTTIVKVAVSQVRRGFETPSPGASGRNTPNEVSAAFKVPKEQAQRNCSTLYEQDRANEKKQLNVVVIGHVDAGKSTLMGHLLYATGNVTQRVMHRYEQESKKLGKQSFMYAWILDETGEERTRGITMDVGQSRIETCTKTVTLLDAPGHKDFIPNMISGSTQADAALLVVDATRGEFETGFEMGGQTREHALLVRSLGVQQLGVVINKLDTVNWSQERFNEIVHKLRAFLKTAGFKDNEVSFTPCSGLSGENLTTPASDPALTSWYAGSNLLNVIDNFKIPERALDRPMRLCVADIFKATGTGLCLAGRIETGMLAVNDRVLVGASREPAQIKGITMDDACQTMTHAYAGDQVCVTLSGYTDISNVQVGHIVCDPLYPVPVTNRVQARILVFNVPVPITMGFPVLLHHQSLIEPATITTIIAEIHKGTGEIVKKRPRCLSNNSCAIIELETKRLICIERYADFKELGRFMLRVAGVTIAAGMVTKIR